MQGAAGRETAPPLATCAALRLANDTLQTLSSAAGRRLSCPPHVWLPCVAAMCGCHVWQVRQKTKRVVLEMPKQEVGKVWRKLTAL